MKLYKSVVIISTMSAFCFLKAQVVAEVPTLELLTEKQMVTDGVNFSKQMTQIVQQTNYLLDAKEKLEKVSSHIKNAKMVKDLIEDEYELYELMVDAINVAKSKDFSIEVVENLESNIETVLDRTNTNKEVLEGIIKNNYFSMSDAERLTFLKEASRDIKSAKSEVYYALLKAEKYNDVLKLYQGKP